MICFDNKRYLFDMKTGVRLSKLSSALYQPIVIHDVLNSRFFMISTQNGDIQYLVDFKID
jgi:hypothetical protein